MSEVKTVMSNKKCKITIIIGMITSIMLLKNKLR
jgi:hypothetical protein